MNNNFSEAEELLNELSEVLVNAPNNVDVIICPPALYLELAMDFLEDGAFSIGAQDVSANKPGAYTGEISANMLQSMQVEYSIVGHSERRKYFGESSELIAQKVEALLEQDLIPIFCCGEGLEERENNQHFDVVKKQIEEALFKLDPLDFIRLIIAYEPVWAIGTGKTASPEQAQEMHAYIRTVIESHFGKEIARKIPLLYGGSCNAKNAKELFAQADVDGGLIGGAALNAKDFETIVNAF